MKCTIDGCDRNAKYYFPKVICMAHYMRFRLTGEYGEGYIRPKHTGKICSIPECGRKYYANGHCQLHFNRKKNGWDMTKPVRKNSDGGRSAVYKEEAEHNKKVQKAMRENITITKVFRGLNTAKK